MKKITREQRLPYMAVQAKESLAPAENFPRKVATKRSLLSDKNQEAKRVKSDGADKLGPKSQIEAIPGDKTLDVVLAALFPGEEAVRKTIKARASECFKENLPFLIGERKLDSGEFIYDEAHMMAKPYIQMRLEEKYKSDFGLKMDKTLFHDDLFFVFAGEDVPVVPLGKAAELEKQGLSVSDLDRILRFSEMDRVRDAHLISMSRITFSLLFEEKIVGHGSGINADRFTVAMPAKEKRERMLDLLASAACNDGNRLLPLLLEKGVDPFQLSWLRGRTPYELALRDNATSNLAIIGKPKKPQE